MNDREAFKFRFMAACIDHGLTTPSEMLTAVKQASDALMTKQADGVGIMGLGEAIGGIGKAIGGVGSTALSWGIPLALATPPVVGAIGGHLAAKAQDIDDFDVDEAKDQEVTDTYRQQAARLRRQGLLRRHGMDAPRPGNRPMF